ncbi:MAG: type IX secretion system membrane protein PorP/SprF [Bacteroidales bacterium]|jgi:type IX secretion system PorP/SprF family membrane protein|nr:type IX secretion system membrane protein PorP/SprF [Bacteroidales bacterium]MDD4214237.1 type IX secretion system membrane protein PorP/SprF [Bacteroidales bacterium]
MDKENNIDKLFKEKLAEYKPDFVPEHWQMMKAAIANPRNSGIAGTGKNTANLLLIISAIIIVSMGIFTYVLSEKLRLEGNNDKLTGQFSIEKNNNTFVENVMNNSSPENITSGNNEIYKNANEKNNGLSDENFSSDDDKNASDVINAGNAANKTNKAGRHDNIAITNNYTGKVKNNSGDNNNTLTKENLTSGNTENNKNNLQEENIQIIKDKDKDVTFPEYQPVNNAEDIDNSGKEMNDIVLLEPQKADETVQNEEVKNSDDNVSSVIDDYNSKKQQAEARKKLQSERNAKRGSKSKVNLETPPDYKIGILNNFEANPAYAGYNQRHTISVSTMVYKPLYKPGNDFNVPFGYKLAYDLTFGKRKNFGAGIDYSRFIGGAGGSLSVDMSFSYRFTLAPYHYLRVGATATFLSLDVNNTSLTFSDMIDNHHGFVFGTNEIFPGKTAQNKFDLGVGVWYSWESLYVGLSANHLTSPEAGLVSLYRIPREYMLSAGYALKFGDNFGMLPAIEMLCDEKTFRFTPAALFTYKRWLLFGAEFRNLKNAGIILGFNIKDNVIINLHTGLPMNKILIQNFGIIDYAGINVRLQFGGKR